MNLLRLILLPLCLIYFIIIYLRNLFYDLNIFRIRNFSTPVISVGNITTGGTGKTPFVIYLTNYLLSKGKSVGVISRGYKSKSNRLVIAYDGKSITSDVHSSGDELFMIINRFSGINKFYAIAYHDRVQAIDEMINKFSPDVIILDDAFQNRRVHKSIDIVLNDKENTSLLNNILLPAGNLRETVSSLNRADIIFNNYKFSNPDSSDSNVIKYEFTGYFDAHGNRNEIRNDKKVILISGIANNNSFQNFVTKHNINISKVYKLSDHYNYSADDIHKYKSDFNENIIFLTTEKDFIKIREFNDFVSNYPVYYLRIDVILINSMLNNILIKEHIL